MPRYHRSGRDEKGVNTRGVMHRMEKSMSVGDAVTGTG